MYVYVGFINCPPYADNELFIMIFEEGFGFAKPVRAVWQWNKDGNETSTMIYTGRIVRAEQKKDGQDIFGIFYDTYPMDVTVEDDEHLSVAVLRKPTLEDASPSPFTTVSLSRVKGLDSRTDDTDYNPLRALPAVHYYDPGWFQADRNYLWYMFLPGNLSSGAEIFLLWQDTKQTYCGRAAMSLTSDDGTKVTAQFQLASFTITITLSRIDGSWFAISVYDSSGHDIPPPSRHKALVAGISCIKGNRPAIETLRSLPSNITLESIQHKVPAISEIEDALNLLSTTSTINNDTQQGIMCTLTETASEVKQYVLAGAGMAMGIVGLFPLGPFGTPVAVIGAMLAGAGLYDTLNQPDGPTRGFLLPGQNLTRTTSGSFTAFGSNNDLTLTYCYIQDKSLVVRTGFKEKVGSEKLNLSTLLRQEGLFTDMFKIYLPNLDRQVIQTCVIASFKHFIPTNNKLKDLGPMDKDPDYLLDDGEVIRHEADDNTLYAPFSGSPSSGTVLFEVSLNKTAVLAHAFVGPGRAPRMHSIIIQPQSKVVLLRLEGASLERSWSGSDVNEGISVVGRWSFTDEKAVLAAIDEQPGYVAYYWASPRQLLGYEVTALAKEAKITVSPNTFSYVYIPLTQWLPWQRLVSRS